MRDEQTVALNRRARHEFTHRRDVRGWHRPDRDGDQVDPRRQGQPVRRLCPDRAWRGVADRRPHRAVRGRQPLQPRAEADAQAPPPPLARSTSCSAGPRPRARPSSRSGSTSTPRAGPRSSSALPAASSSTTADAISPTATPGATSRASSPTPSAAARRGRVERGRPAAADPLWVARSSRRSMRTRPASRGGSSSAASRSCPGATMFETMTWLQANRDDLRLRMLREPRGYPAANCNLILPLGRPGRRRRLRDHGAGRIPGDVRHEHDVRRHRAARDRDAADDRAGHRADPRSRRPGSSGSRADCRDGKVGAVTFRNVPAFATHLDAPVEVPQLGTVDRRRRLRRDVLRHRRR